jgi:hypothetical protein
VTQTLNNLKMEQTDKPSKSYLQFGLMYGVIMVLLFVIIYALGIDPAKDRAISLSQSILSNLILPLLFIYLGCVSFKKANNGFASFVECLKVGVSIAFVAGLIFAVFNTIFNLIFPEYSTQMLQSQREIMLTQNPNMTSEQVDMGLSIAKKMMSPIFAFPIVLITFSFFGLIYSLIIGLIVKKDNPQGF